MRKLMACLVMVGYCNVAVAGDATSVPPVTSNTANLNTTKPGVAGVVEPLVGRSTSCKVTGTGDSSGTTWTAYFQVTSASEPRIRLVGPRSFFFSGDTGWVSTTGLSQGGTTAAFSTTAPSLSYTYVRRRDKTDNMGDNNDYATVVCYAKWP